MDEEINAPKNGAIDIDIVRKFAPLVKFGLNLAFVCPRGPGGANAE